MAWHHQQMAINQRITAAYQQHGAYGRMARVATLAAAGAESEMSKRSIAA